MERDPEDIRYVHERAKAYQMIDYHEQAVDDYTAVIDRNPKNAHAHFRRAFSLKALKVSFVDDVTEIRGSSKWFWKGEGPGSIGP